MGEAGEPPHFLLVPQTEVPTVPSDAEHFMRRQIGWFNQWFAVNGVDTGHVCTIALG